MAGGGVVGWEGGREGGGGRGRRLTGNGRGSSPSTSAAPAFTLLIQTLKPGSDPMTQSPQTQCLCGHHRPHP